MGLAERFAELFHGVGAWHGTPPARRAAFATALRPNPAEWEAACDPGLRPARWATVTAPTLLVWARDTAPLLRAVIETLRTARSDWTVSALPRGGHLAPLTRPRDFAALAVDFLATR